MLAGAIAAMLAIVVVLVVVLSADEGDNHSFEPAPQACVDAWNGDSMNLILGQHQATAHHYSKIQVVRFGTDGAIAPETDTSAPCGMVFGSSSLDTELAAAALVESPRGWRPLSDQDVPSETLSDLQFAAQDDYNALINTDGTIEAL